MNVVLRVNILFPNCFSFALARLYKHKHSILLKVYLNSCKSTFHIKMFRLIVAVLLVSSITSLPLPKFEESFFQRFVEDLKEPELALGAARLLTKFFALNARNYLGEYFGISEKQFIDLNKLEEFVNSIPILVMNWNNRDRILQVQLFSTGNVALNPLVVRK